MWRRVLSQSPTTADLDGENAVRTARYLAGWKSLGALIHSGRSLSGHERNCCFLNTRGSRFANVSSAAGLDHDADSRGLALIDWDGDGDLDLWTVNRTSPRIRYLQNDLGSKSHFLAIKLRGVRCNRDAIGARVELIFEDDATEKFVRRVSAGEGFVSQSSKWLHFGLGDRKDIDRIIVHWPGGESEQIKGVSVDQRYEIVQGDGRATSWVTNPSVLTPVDPSPQPVAAAATRIQLARRLPLPKLQIVSFDGQIAPLEFSGKPVVINLWASWCQPCVQELSEWQEYSQKFEEIGVDIFALNVELAAKDSTMDLDQIREAWNRLGFPFTGLAVDVEGLEVLEAIERVMTLKQEPLPIPSSFLLDGSGNLVAVYKGPVAAEQLIQDLQQLDQSQNDARDRAVPFQGKWYTDEFPPDLIAIPMQMVGLGRGQAAYDYLEQCVIPDATADSVDAWVQLGVTNHKLVKLLHDVAKLLIQDGKNEEAVNAYRWALRYDPQSWPTNVQLSALLIRLGRSADALAQNRKMSQLRKGHPLPWNNIAWVMATSADSKIRDATKAVDLAEKICRATQFKEPTALDTLAVAYAAAGRFEDARQTARKAIAQADSLGNPRIVETIRSHLECFEADRPFEQNSSRVNGSR